MKGVKALLKLVEELVPLVFRYARTAIFYMDHNATCNIVDGSTEPDESLVYKFQRICRNIDVLCVFSREENEIIVAIKETLFP